MTTNALGRIVLDSHVHFYACYSLPDFLHWATTNADALARQAGWSSGYDACLILTEAAGEGSVDRLHRYAGHAVDGWQVEPAAEPHTLSVTRTGGTRLWLLPGTQVVCAERLEVLALGAHLPGLDGQPLDHVLNAVRAGGAIPVLPWGAGKWLGARGRAVGRELEAATPGTLFAGDNGGRARGLPTPAAFRVAERRGIAVLPGSDPLPFAADVRRVGSYGWAMEGAFDPGAPARSIIRMIAGQTASPAPLGTRVSLARFAAGQIALRLARRANGA